jgi:adenine-specific DNA-methyltransferase
VLDSTGEIFVKAPATTQKLRGSYYTPRTIARFLADWSIQSAAANILEPSCGDGNILEAAVEVLLTRGADKPAIPQQVYGVELDVAEAEKAASRLTTHGIPRLDNVWIGDFFQFCEQRLFSEMRFDAVIGNPPFIRYQNFQEAHRVVAFRLMKHAGLRPTRLTNSWVPFLVASTLMLNPAGGRLAMVIPAELLQVGYAAELRRFLTNNYSKITLFTFRKLVFDNIQQEVVLLLGERNGKNHTGIRTIELHGLDDLVNYQHEVGFADPLKEMDHTTEKWTQYYLDQRELDLLRSLRADKRLTIARNAMEVDVGIVTGLNEFFVLTEQQAATQRLLDYTRPIVTRSAHLQGIDFTPEDLRENTARQLPSRLLCLSDLALTGMPEAVRSYILMGEGKGFHEGYKCRIRDRWYVVPSVWTPDAFMLRQIHSYPKLILNETDATSTDTIHRVRFISKLPPKTIVAAFLNSLTFAFTEIIGRSYGGGVLELEPNEAQLLPLPLQNAEKLDFDRLDALMRIGDVESVLDITDEVLLRDGLGLSQGDLLSLRSAWYRLRDRRINRNHNKGSG